MKNINIFTKTFVTILFLMLGGIMIAYVILYNMMPSFYKNYKSSQMDKEIQLVYSNTKLTIPYLKQYLSSLSNEFNLNAVICNASDDVIFDVATMNSFHYSSVDSGDNMEIEPYVIDNNSEYEIENSVEYNDYQNKIILEKTYLITVDGEKYKIIMKIPLQPLDESKHVLIMI